MVTPALISYTEFAGATLRHSDIKFVIHLRSDHVPYLVPFKNLRMLVLSPQYTSTYVLCAGNLVKQLTQDINTCPTLQYVEFTLSGFGYENPRVETSKREIIEEIRAVRPGVEVVFTTKVTPMPGSMEESLVSVLGSSPLAG